MSYKVLARKWRPRNFAGMVGQGHVLKALANALDTDRLHHAYLFTGTRGVGKTTLARILAKCLNCEQGVSSNPCGICSACTGIDESRFVDLIEVDAASRAKVDETRDLMDNVQYAPAAGRYKIYLIDEVHMFSNHSFNALLKTLEEPPPHVKFLLATTEPKKLPVTILSRCLQFNLKHLTVEQIAGQIRNILEQEQVPADDASIRLIASAANGSMRDALSLLDQAIAYNNGRLAETPTREMLGTIDSAAIIGLLEVLIDGNAVALLERIANIAAFNPDYDAILAELLTRLHDLAVAQVLPADSDVIDASTRALLDKVSREDVQLYYQIGLTGRRDLAISPDPKIGFEMTLIRMHAFRPGNSNLASPVPAGKPAIVVPAVKEKPVATGNQQAAGLYAEANTDWQKIIDEMALAGLVRELAGHCVLKEHTTTKVTLALTPAQEHLLKTTQKDRLQDAIRTRFGKDVKLVITVEEPGVETPAARKSREEKERQVEAVKSFVEDNDVQSMLTMFDATLDKNSIRLR
ncbi:MAG: DNA polymerase III, subunit gamma and tau [Gammaproteobacteria bacterium RIFCSPLOWO2_02_FULL_52_10]|nr:MAG: DNA polymerase III, subunit gamma and tau [Gammaproteobacteria bacterium RIFCSPLOWO2_02_FULL_52_10]